jgi:hypothetical protein
MPLTLTHCPAAKTEAAASRTKLAGMTAHRNFFRTEQLLKSDADAEARDRPGGKKLR